LADLRIVIDGDDAEHVADELSAILAEGEPSGTIARSVTASLPDPTRKLIDPVALAGVILAIPGSVLAAMDIVDRLRKRGKAEQLVVAAKRLRRGNRVSISISAADGTTRSLDQLQADTILELAGGTES
jgi:hypothetical protein